MKVKIREKEQNKIMTLRLRKMVGIICEKTVEEKFFIEDMKDRRCFAMATVDYLGDLPRVGKVMAKIKGKYLISGEGVKSGIGFIGAAVQKWSA